MKAGVLAVQGDFREHALMFAECGATPILVRTPADLGSVACLSIPGGESTAIGRLLRRYDLVEPIRQAAARGMPIYGTCAGMIVMARTVHDGEPLLSLIDLAVRRNAYGRQSESFEADVDVKGIGKVRAVFIRAPRVEGIGPEVEVLAEHEDDPVVVRQGALLASTFHPEIASDARLHELLLGMTG